MAYSKAIANAIFDFLDNDNWHYDFDEANEVIRCGVSLKCKLQSTRLIIDLWEDKYLVFATISLHVEEENRAEMARLLNMINYNLPFGNFEMDEADGEVRFRFAVDCDDCLPSQAVVKDSILIPALMFEKYGDAIAIVLMGFATAQEAYRSLRQK